MQEHSCKLDARIAHLVYADVHVYMYYVFTHIHTHLYASLLYLYVFVHMSACGTAVGSKFRPVQPRLDRFNDPLKADIVTDVDYRMSGRQPSSGVTGSLKALLGCVLIWAVPDEGQVGIYAV